MSSVTVPQILVVGIGCGLLLEGVCFIARNERYVSVAKFVRDYPGYSIIGASSLIALGIFYKDVIGNAFHPVTRSLTK